MATLPCCTCHEESSDVPGSSMTMPASFASLISSMALTPASPFMVMLPSVSK